MCRGVDSGKSGIRARKGTIMDYGKSGAPKGPKNQPRHNEHVERGGGKSGAGNRSTKAELLERMKAAAAAKAKTED